MRSSFTLALLAAALAAASPLANPELVVHTRVHTNVRVVVQTITVSGAGEATPTPTPSPDGQSNGDYSSVRVFRAFRRPRVTITHTIRPTPSPSPTPEVVQVAQESREQAQPNPSPEPAPEPTSEPVVQQPAPTPEPQPQPAPVVEQAAPAQAPSSGSTYQDDVMRSHNEGRAKHGVVNLEWDDELAAIALKQASTCRYEHDFSTGGGGYGQNIAAGGKAENVKDVITKQFYSEVRFYQWYGAEPSMEDFELWGHFSQIVWKDTTKVACATYDCSAQGIFYPLEPGNRRDDVPPHYTVCNYRKGGNVTGRYAQNVLAPVA